MNNFNQLTPAETERLAILAEECGEVIQAVGKILRHGYEGTHPHGGPNNRQLLELECGDVLQILQLMYQNCDLEKENILKRSISRRESIKVYTHHQ